GENQCRPTAGRSPLLSWCCLTVTATFPAPPLGQCQIEEPPIRGLSLSSPPSAPSRTRPHRPGCRLPPPHFFLDTLPFLPVQSAQLSTKKKEACGVRRGS